MGSIENAEHYDLISLGSGEAGKYIAWTEGSKGKRCAVIERKWLGGSCPNVACLPSKNVIHSAKLIAAHGDRLLQGYNENKSLNQRRANMLEVRKRKEDMVNELMAMHDGNFKKNGVHLVWGDGKIIGPKQLEVIDIDGDRRVLQGDVIVICTGSRAIIPEIPGLKESHPLTHVEILELEEVPDHLVIIGGGYIGLEFAQALKRFGASVTVVDHNDRILKREDEDVAVSLKNILEREGVKFVTSASISSVSGKSGDKVTLKGRQGDGSLYIEASHILCATGQTPNTDNIGLDAAGIKLTQAGHVEVDEWNRATGNGVFAVGDCAGSPHFTHIAFDDFRIVRDYLAGKADHNSARRSSRQVPFTLFTDPEFAHVGLREHEAKTRGIQYRFAKLPMAAFLKTRTLGVTEGFAKVLVSKDSDEILGFSAIGSAAGELLPAVQLAMRRSLPYTDLANLVITHPTLSEGLVALFGSVSPD